MADRVRMKAKTVFSNPLIISHADAPRADQHTVIEGDEFSTDEGHAQQLEALGEAERVSGDADRGAGPAPRHANALPDGGGGEQAGDQPRRAGPRPGDCTRQGLSLMSGVVVIVPPQPVVSLDQAKRQCNATGFTDDDALLTDLISTAQGWLDGPDGWLGRAIGVQTLELRLDSFPFQNWGFGLDWTCWDDGQWARWANPQRFANIVLPYPPFIAVTQITYEDVNGVDQVLSSSGWSGSDEGVSPSFGQVWPAGRIDADAIRIQYQAGYTSPSGAPQPPPNPVPAPIRQAMLLLISHLYNHRDAVVGVDNRDSSVEMPLSVTDLLQRYRVYS